MTYFKQKKVGNVRLLLGGLNDDVAVTLNLRSAIASHGATVGDLRRHTVWPTKHRLVIERQPVSEVRVELGHAAHHAE
jgi:hypothetical protein